MFEQAFRNIDDVLRKEAGCTTELDYTEQSSWLLFLKYLDGLEADKAAEAGLDGKKYAYILEKPYRWDAWAAPKGKDGQLDHNRALVGDDLTQFVNTKLFPYLMGFKTRATGADTIEYKIGEIFGEIKNKIQSGYNLREIIDHIDELRFRSQTEKHELSHLYEAKIKNMGNAGRNGGEYYTPRPLIRAMISVVAPKLGERIYDGACGSAGFLCESFDYLRRQNPRRTTAQDRRLQEATLYGKEKKSLAYVIAIMNLILHGIEAPNIIHTNTLSENLADIQERDRYDVVLANPPFGGKERPEVQQNFPKEGINDGFLTPFRVKQIQTTLDYYVYTSDDTVVEGEVEAGKMYEEADFNRTIEIREREKKRVEIFLSQIKPNDKTLVFCANQAHALLSRDLINQLKASKDPNYCHRVTADDGALGEQWLRDFQDNEKTIPTILTTSQKLSTGVDARNVRNIVLLRPINSMIEFKQIIGRGTRLFDGKDYFTIYDFVKAHQLFQDPEWDGPPQGEEACPKCGQRPCVCVVPPPMPCEVCGQSPCECPEEPCPVCGQIRCICGKKKKVRVKLADGKERAIQHMMMTTFWHPDGTPMSAPQFMELLFGKLPDFFQSEEELRKLWSTPDTRAKLLAGLAEKGFGHDQLAEMQKCIDAEKSDIFDVLAYVRYNTPTITREARADQARIYINSNFNAKQQAFLDFVLQHYVSVGVEELDQQKLKPLLRLKYHDSIADAVADLGQPEEIGQTFAGFQKSLYQTVG